MNVVGDALQQFDVSSDRTEFSILAIRDRGSAGALRSATAVSASSTPYCFTSPNSRAHDTFKPASGIGGVSVPVHESMLPTELSANMFPAQVPPEALLDVEVEEEGQTATGAAEPPQPTQQGVQGEIAFLSHEPVVCTAKTRGRAAAAGKGSHAVSGVP